MRTIILSLLAALLIAAPAASFDWDDCSGNTSGALYTIYKYDRTCIGINTTDDTNDTRLFFVRAKSATLCFDPNIGWEGTDLGTIFVRECPNGQKPASNPHYECDKVTDELTGANLDPGPQMRCRVLPTGSYYVDVATDMGAARQGRVTINGGGD